MNETLMLTLKLTLAGLGIVFVALVLISFTVALIRKADSKWEDRETLQRVKALEKPQTIDELTLVLISAAIATCISGRYRIRGIRRIQTAGKTSPWSMQGRLVLAGSHILQTKPGDRL